ncbi:MAG: hypothetical protein AAGD34_14540 [Pseudomonadota bacterium]
MRGIAIALICLATSQAAAAERLSGDEVRSYIFGAHLFGTVEGTDQPWNECIEPDGSTVYQIAGERVGGQATVDGIGRACFIYPHSGSQSCFFVERVGGKIVFQSTGATIRFRVDRDVRPIKECDGTVPLS